jgi:alkylation response protein AidB-like acyl-CoA dehydrogenase
VQLPLSPQDGAFRDRVRAFFKNDYPREILAKTRAGQPLTRTDHVNSQRALQARSWYAINWPVEYGGPGWSALQRYIFDEELERAGAPNVIPMSVIYLGPVIYTFGTEEQKKRWLPDILEARSFWAQGYSEPEAGSDLTSLSLAARREGGEYVLNGTKIWTSMAHWADWIFCLVRTSRGQRKEEGISFLCAQMSSPGITVHPILSLDGSHHLNRVTFDDVRVPVGNLIGEEGKGWKYARFLLVNERFSYAHVGRKKVDLARLSEPARGHIAAGWLDSTFMLRIARCDIDVLTLEACVLRLLSQGHVATTSASASLKILATQTAQRISELQLEMGGHHALGRPEALANVYAGLPSPQAPNFATQAMAGYLFERAQTIYGGSTEVQKNIIAGALLRAR